MQPFQLTDRIPIKEFWCNWAMGSMTYNGLRNPHQECCHMSSRWVRFKAGEIHRSENVAIPMQPNQLTDRVPRKEIWCDWAMGSMMHIGRRNPHQECCQFSHMRYVKCQYEGCLAYVHKFCQLDWLKEHGYEVPTNLPTFCRDHTESYGLWVKFTAGLIPWSQNGCIPGSVAAIGEFRRHV